MAELRIDPTNPKIGDTLTWQASDLPFLREYRVGAAISADNLWWPVDGGKADVYGNLRGTYLIGENLRELAADIDQFWVRHKTTGVLAASTSMTVQAPPTPPPPDEKPPPDEEGPPPPFGIDPSWYPILIAGAAGIILVGGVVAYMETRREQRVMLMMLRGR